MATFGTTTIGGTTATWSGNFADVVGPFASPAGTLTKISVYLSRSGGSGVANAIPVLYADNSGAPGALLAQGSAVGIPTPQAAGWLDFPISYALTSASYWIGLAVATSSSDPVKYYDTLASGDEFKSISYPTLPNPYAGGGTDNRKVSVYATYTLAGPPAPSGGGLPRQRTRLKVF